LFQDGFVASAKRFRFKKGSRRSPAACVPIPRDKYVERCKQRAFDYLDRGDLKSTVSSFVNNMDARSDREMPHHLAELVVVLWMSKDLQGWKALIEGIK